MYRIKERLATLDGRSFLLLIGEEDGVRYWGKALPTERSLSELEELFTLLQTLDYPALPAPVAWGSGLVVDSESKSFIIYPWIDGVKLDAAWSTADSLQREHWMIEILRALDILHFRGVVHGDLKPENILIDANGSAKLIDLDWSFRSHETLERKSGTLAWIAPEALEGSPPDGRSDLYSLSLVLHALAVEPGLDASSAQERLDKDLRFDRLDADDPWRDWMERCCRRDPRQRWESAFQAAQAAPWLDPLEFYRPVMIQSRYRLRVGSEASFLQTIQREFPIAITPGGFFATELEAKSFNESHDRWLRILGQPEIAEALNAGRGLSEALMESVWKRLQAISATTAQPDLSNPVLRALEEAYESGDHETVLREGEANLLSGSFNPSEKATIQNLLGLSLAARNRLEEALHRFLEVQKLSAECSDRLSEGKALGNMGLIYFRQGNFDLARKRFLEGLAIARALEETQHVSAYLMNLASVEQKTNCVVEALAYLAEAQEISRATANDRMLSHCAFNRSLLLGDCGGFDQALESLDRALEALAEPSSERALVAWRRLEVLLDAERLDEAQRWLTEAIPPLQSVELAHPYAAMPLRLRYRAAILGLVDVPVDRSPQRLETWLGDLRDTDDGREIMGWTAYYFHYRGEEEEASAWLEKIETSSLSPDSPLRGLAAWLALNLYRQPHQVDLRRSAEVELNAYFERWNRRVPKPFQRDLWAHPFYKRIREALQPTADQDSPTPTPVHWKTLLRAVRSLSQLPLAKDPDAMVQQALEALVDLSRAERGFVVLKQGRKETVAAAIHFQKETIEHPQFEMSRSLLHKAMSRGEEILSVNAQNEEDLGRSVYDLNLRSVLLLPLIHQGEVLGVAYLDHRRQQGVFGEESMDLLRIVAGQIASAIHFQRISLESARQAEQLADANRKLQREVARKTAQEKNLQQELEVARQNLQERFGFGELIGKSPAMQNLFHQVERVRDANLPALVTGESGTGKELLARTLHFTGLRADRPFIALNCGALPENLVEAELFGYRRGAFTGAHSDRTGAFVQAKDGTLFLDEIGAMSLAQQVKLLRALQESEIRPLGSEKSIPVHARIVAATNEDLKKAIEENRFREDLYYRLNGIELRLPALRERPEDIPLLIRHFQERWEAEGNDSRELPAEMLQQWMNHRWPGNIRQLQNSCQRYFLLGENLPAMEKAPSGAPGGAGSPIQPNATLLDGSANRIQRMLEEYEAELLRWALQESKDNRTEAARLLGITRNSFYHRLRKHRLL